MKSRRAFPPTLAVVRSSLVPPPSGVSTKVCRYRTSLVEPCLRWVIANAKRFGRSNSTISMSAVCGLPTKTCSERKVEPILGGPPETDDIFSLALGLAHSGWCSTSARVSNTLSGGASMCRVQ